MQCQRLQIVYPVNAALPAGRGLMLVRRRDSLACGPVTIHSARRTAITLSSLPSKTQPIPAIHGGPGSQDNPLEAA
jgi:hypothetical protein